MEKKNCSQNTCFKSHTKNLKLCIIALLTVIHHKKNLINPPKKLPQDLLSPPQNLLFKKKCFSASTLILSLFNYFAVKKIKEFISVSLFFPSFFRANTYLTDANKNNLSTVAPKKDKQNENNILKLH